MALSSFLHTSSTITLIDFGRPFIHTAPSNPVSRFLTQLALYLEVNSTTEQISKNEVLDRRRCPLLLRPRQPSLGTASLRQR
jgi:hypothetical protein